MDIPLCNESPGIIQNDISDRDLRCFSETPSQFQPIMMKGMGKIKKKKERVSEHQDAGVSRNPNTRKNL